MGAPTVMCVNQIKINLSYQRTIPSTPNGVTTIDPPLSARSWVGRGGFWYVGTYVRIKINFAAYYTLAYPEKTIRFFFQTGSDKGLVFCYSNSVYRSARPGRDKTRKENESMKGKRLVASMLALLLVVSLLPMAAMADYIEIQPGDTVDEIKPGDATGSNPGTVNNNHGNVSTNTATIVNNGTAGGGRDSGHVSTNSGRIENNYGYVGNSHGTINHNQSGGYVSGNNSGGTVETNAENATIDSNVGTVGKKDESGNVIEGSGNSGTIKENYGTVFTNNATGIVESNDKRGTIEVNNGLVGKKDGNGNLITDGPSGNSGTVKNNKDGGVVVNNSGGEVYNNYSSGDGTNPGVINNGGTVSANQDGGTVVNNEGGYVSDNYSNGDGTNPGVINNGGTVNINNGTVDNFAGQVHFNNEGGKILNNYGIVGESFKTCQSGTPNDPWVPTEFNKGTVVTNHMSGEVTNNTYHGGVVEKNYGTVYDAPGQIKATYYGLHGEDENKETDTKYTEEGYSLGHTAGAEVNLDDTAASYQREGYKLSSYTVWTYDKTSTADDKLVQQTVADRTKYTINAPTLLKLVWEKIVTAVASSGGGEAVPTSYNPEYIGLGSVVTINGSRYKVVEIKDDALVVVSFDALSDEDVKDLDALFAKLFTAEQQKLIKNVGQLLDSEDVLTIFGKPGNHPVFEISKDLPK